MARVLVATPEPIGRRLAGPAARAAHLARLLADHHDVVLASAGGPSTSPIDDLEVVGLDSVRVDSLDAAIVQGSTLLRLPDLVDSSVPIAVDWFDPFHTEALHRGGGDRIRRMDLVEGARSTLLAQAERGDFFVCSNEPQRLHWLGWLAAAGRLNHLNHEADPGFGQLIRVAPFGAEPPSEHHASTTPLRDSLGVVGPDDPIVLWAGGLHDWLDPLTAIRAMPTLRDRHPDARLVFLAGPHPNTAIEQMGRRGDAIDLARDLGLFGDAVVFVTRWIDYDERLSWLADATIGVVAHQDHLEAELSHRTRLLDHCSAGLPTVSTAGDPLSADLAAAGAATLVGPEDPDELAEVIGTLLADELALRRMSAVATDLASELAWNRTLAPLLEWADRPAPAPDVAPGAVTGRDGGAAATPMARLMGRTRMHLAEGGVRQLADRARAWARRRTTR